jgi:HD-GYP domain-containing protein (c-di-GMP phosphodiesterase class II)
MILMSLEDVRPGMVVGVGLRNREGHTVLGPGEVLTPDYIGRLRELGYWAVWIDDTDTRDIPHEEPLSEATRVATLTAIQDTFALISTPQESDGFGSLSPTEIRKTLESRRIQQAFHGTGAVDRLLSQVDRMVEEVLDRPVLTGLGSLRTHSAQLYHHCLDVTVTATMIGRLLGYDRQTLKKLAIGCIVHDIGNIFVDSALLDTPGRFARDEFGQVKDHALIGYLFMRDSLRLGVLASHVAYQHHERQDGTGYPRGLRGTNRIVEGAEVHVPGRINPLGEIAAVADYHDICAGGLGDARPRMPADEAWRAVRGAAGHHLNRAIVDAFLAVLPPYPLGSQVTVTAGRWRDHRGVVSRLDRQALDRPVVRLLINPAGERIAPVEIDLREDDVTIRSLAGTDATALSA